MGENELTQGTKIRKNSKTGSSIASILRLRRTQ